jgi:hypothetical protein
MGKFTKFELFYARKYGFVINTNHPAGKMTVLISTLKIRYL